jgi:TetR/AcrR family transcriptional regulator, lmrAB and yxaGH operons repressor
MATTTDTRTRFVEAAAELLHERGYEGMSLSDVLSRSGAPRGSLYYHFPGGKDELVCEATRFGVNHVSAFLKTCFGPDADPVDAVRRYANEAARELAESGFIFGCPVAPIVLDGVASAKLRVICREAMFTWQRIIAERLRLAGLDHERAISFAALLVSAIEGALLVARALREIAPLEQVGSELAAQLEAMLRTREDAYD